MERYRSIRSVSQHRSASTASVGIECGACPHDRGTRGGSFRNLASWCPSRLRRCGSWPGCPPWWLSSFEVSVGARLSFDQSFFANTPLPLWPSTAESAPIRILPQMVKLRQHVHATAGGISAGLCSLSTPQELWSEIAKKSFHDLRNLNSRSVISTLCCSTHHGSEGAPGRGAAFLWSCTASP